jgi:tripeptidyl-peptidase I
MTVLQVSVLAAIVAFSHAAPAPAPAPAPAVRHVLHEERQTWSSDWVKGARIEADAVLPLRIGLTQTNLDKGQDFLMEV